MQKYLGICCLFLVGALGGHAAPIITSTFDSDAEGWSLTDSLLGTPVISVLYSATGGNPDGNIQAQNPNLTRASFHAPNAFLGDWLSLGVTSVSYDLYVGSSFQRSSTLHFVLTNGTTIIGYYAPTPATGAWVSMDLQTTSPTGWFYATNSVNNGGAVSAADFQAVLGNVTGVRVVADFEQMTAASRLDNFSLNGPERNSGGIPEPSTFGLLCVAIAAGGIKIRQRRI